MKGTTKSINKVLNRLTGVSFPIFGLSWNPRESDRQIARDIVNFLSGRRLIRNTHRIMHLSIYDEISYENLRLHIDSFYNDIEYSGKSALKIRDFCTEQLARIDESSSLNKYLYNLRNHCLDFASQLQRNIHISTDTMENDARVYIRALEDLLNNVGTIIGKLILSYGIETFDPIIIPIIPKDLLSRTIK